MKKFDIFVILFFILTAAIFLLYPQIDIKFSSIFYNKESGFYLANTFFANLIFKLTIIIIATFSIMLLILLIADILFKKEFFKIKKRILIYLMLTLLLGPGLIVNTIFKNNWGRARPVQIEEFGGNKKFTPPFIKTNQCQKNCSFSSGHASAAFFFLALVPLFREKRVKVLTAILAISWGLCVGFVRIIQGGHFLSDVIFSGFFVYFVASILYYIIFRSNNEAICSNTSNERRR